MSAALSFGRKYGMMTKGNNKSHYRVKPRKMLGPYSGVLPSFTLGWTFFLPLANFISSYKGGEMREKRTPHRCDAITASLQGRAAPWTLRAFTEFFFFYRVSRNSSPRSFLLAVPRSTDPNCFGFVGTLRGQPLLIEFNNSWIWLSAY